MKLEELQGSWALVTGASAGIGEVFAQKFAELGINLILISRRLDKLNELGEKLKKKYKIQFLTFGADLSNAGYGDAIKSIHEDLQNRGIKIRILCNNAGVTIYGDFSSLNESVDQQLINLNVNSVVMFCRTFLPDLATHSKGILINVSSQAAFQPTPFFITYGATKSFILNFSLGLYTEYKERGVYVQTLVPAVTKTESVLHHMTNAARGIRFGTLLPPEDVVRVSLEGIQKEKPLVTNVSGLWGQKFLATIVPTEIFLKEIKKRFTPKP